MKKILFSLIALSCCISICAQTMKLYKSGQLVKEFSVSEVDSIVFGESNTPETDANLLSGKFSASATKQVQFAKSNIYWNGTSFEFEENQTDYPTSYVSNHVGHFFWTSYTNYQSGIASFMPYASSYTNSGEKSTSDEFWCGENHKITVNGTDDLYTLTNTEWGYIVKDRTNASILCKYGVTVDNNGTKFNNCLIIAPDDYNYSQNPLKSEYTLEEVNRLGLVCLPADGTRGGSNISGCDESGQCCSSTPHADNSDWAYTLDYSSTGVYTTNYSYRGIGHSVRLVKTVDNHEYVDLGLPSGTLWATCNIGAEKPEEYGLYFAWGETIGYGGDTSDGHYFCWEKYKWCNGSNSTMTKYCTDSNYGTVDNKSVLDNEDDAATLNWNHKWCMPSPTQMQELLNTSYTTIKWTTVNSINGLKITSNSNGASIFLPAAGFRDNNGLNVGSDGTYLTNSLGTNYPNTASALWFDSGSKYTGSCRRCVGYSVRPVQVKK